MVNIMDLGNSINQRSSEVLARMVAFGQISAGQSVSLTDSTSGNDVNIGSYDSVIVQKQAGNTFKISDNDASGTCIYVNADGSAAVSGSGNLAAAGSTEYDKLMGIAKQMAASGQLDTSWTAATGTNDNKHTIHAIAGIVVAVDKDILAGGMVTLQAKIDGMLSTVQMSIKNAGQVSQVLQAAARG